MPILSRRPEGKTARGDHRELLGNGELPGNGELNDRSLVSRSFPERSLPERMFHGRLLEDGPLDDRSLGEASPAQWGRKAARAGLFATCANPGCASGWLHFLRSRSRPVFESGWNCSPACTTTRLRAAVRRELEGMGSAQKHHRHRVPLGLLMLEQGWITSAQLRQAVEAQKGAGAGRLGQWLMRQQGVSEQLVTRALGLQWSCPVLSMEFYDAEALTVLVPRLFVDAFAALPLRVAAGKLLYLGFEDRLDPVLALAIERMTGLRVESGLVQGSLFHPAHERLLSARFPRVHLIEASSELAMVQALAKTIERAQPVDSRLVRAHDCLWLRMWLRAQAGPLPEVDSVEDVICSIGTQ
jgi:hypothetical protein